MKILFKLAPHAAIVVGNMYYVFWGIDRVNKSMNFIDNEYTKFLLLILIACSWLTDYRLLPVTLRQLQRSKNPAPVYVRLGLLAANAILAMVVLTLLGIDLFNEDLMLFLMEFVKLLILLLCITGLLNSLLAIARDRAVVRMMNRRTQSARRSAPAQSRPAQPANRSARPSTRIPQQNVRRYSDGRR